MTDQFYPVGNGYGNGFAEELKQVLSAIPDFQEA